MVDQKIIEITATLSEIIETTQRQLSEIIETTQRQLLEIIETTQRQLLEITTATQDQILLLQIEVARVLEDPALEGNIETFINNLI